MPMSSLYQQKTTKKCQNILAKDLKDPLYWNKYKTKSEIRDTTNEYRYFLEPNSVGVN